MGEIVLKPMSLLFEIYPADYTGFRKFVRTVKNAETDEVIWQHVGKVAGAFVTVENLNGLAEQMRGLPFWNINEYILEYL